MDVGLKQLVLEETEEQNDSPDHKNMRKRLLESWKWQEHSNEANQEIKEKRKI